MDGGFSFAGVNIGEIGLFYVPELETTYVYSPAEASIHEETFDGHNGGYYYGAWAQPKEFTLRCYFEMERIDMGIMAKIHNLFKVGKAGKLIFDRRPWCYYWARVSENPTFDLKNYENGLVTIKMKAYYPFARSDTMTNIWTDNHHDEVMRNTALFDKTEMVTGPSFASAASPLVVTGTAQTIELANPGTEPAPVAIALAGTIDGMLTIKNTANDNTVRFVNLTAAATTNVNKHIVCDSLNGKTVLVNDTGTPQPQMAFLYHDSGFLFLESGYPCMRNIHVNYTNASFHATTVNRIEENVTGKYIYLKDKWRRIVNKNGYHDLVLAFAPNATGYEQTTIMDINKLELTAEGTVSLTKLDFIYQPTFA